MGSRARMRSSGEERPCRIRNRALHQERKRAAGSGDSGRAIAPRVTGLAWFVPIWSRRCPGPARGYTSWAGSVLLRDIADVKRLKQEDGPNLVTQGRGLKVCQSASGWAGVSSLRPSRPLT